MRFGLLAATLALVMSAPAAAVDLTGRDIRVTEFMAPSLIVQGVIGTKAFTVGDGIEVATSELGGSPISIDFTSDQIVFRVASEYTFIEPTARYFNGFLVQQTEVGEGLFNRVSILRGFSTFYPRRVLPQGGQFYVNLAGRTLQAGDTLTLSVNVPEPGTWAMMIIGIGVTGGALRRRQSHVPRPALG